MEEVELSLLLWTSCASGSHAEAHRRAGPMDARYRCGRSASNPGRAKDRTLESSADVPATNVPLRDPRLVDGCCLGGVGRSRCLLRRRARGTARQATSTFIERRRNPRGVEHPLDILGRTNRYRPRRSRVPRLYSVLRNGARSSCASQDQLVQPPELLRAVVLHPRAADAAVGTSPGPGFSTNLLEALLARGTVAHPLSAGASARRWRATSCVGAGSARDLAEASVS